MILVTLKKGNHPGEAYVRRGRKKTLSRRERDSLERPHEEAEIQRKALRRGKNLVFSEDACLEKERVRSKVTLRKVGVRLKCLQIIEFNRPIYTFCGIVPLKTPFYFTSRHLLFVFRTNSDENFPGSGHQFGNCTTKVLATTRPRFVLLY